MQNYSIDEIFTKIKEEMVSAWAYLDALEKNYINDNGSQVETFIETSPGFFGLVESSLLESAFSRISRLMDPKQSCGEDNLSFEMLFQKCLDDENLKNICNSFSKLKIEWKQGKYKPLRTYRNKFHSHNDFSKLSNAQPLISCRMRSNEVDMLRELFQDLWAMLKILNSLIRNSALLEPTYGTMDMLPNAFIHYLKVGLNISKALPNHPELLEFTE